MILHLIRHGDTIGTENRLYYGATDLPVSEAGLEKLVALKDAGGYPLTEGMKIYTTGKLRTVQTLQALYGEMEYDTIHELREMEFGIFEMKSYDELRCTPEYIEWLSGEHNSNVCPGGESGNIFGKRICEATQKLVDKNEDCILVAHGGTISVMMMYLFSEECKNHYDWQPKPGEGYTVMLEGDICEYKRLPDIKPYWEGKGYSFTQNLGCEYFPCHKNVRAEDFSCLFCYCPLYALGDKCGGNFRYNDKGYKDCTNCAIPHRRENFGKIIEKYPLICDLAKKKACDS